MKTIKMTILFLGICTLSFAQTNDETNIRKIIEAENINFCTNSNRKVYMNDWLLKPETQWVYSSKDGLQFMTGEDLKIGMAKNLYPPANNATCTFSNFIVKASGNVGWASFDKKMITPDGKVDYVHAFRCMEKIENAWKIISASEHQYQPK